MSFGILTPTSHVCMQLFREQVAEHVSSVTVSLETADQQLIDLYSAVTSSHEKLKSTSASAEAATASADAACSAVEELTARLKKVRSVLWALGHVLVKRYAPFQILLWKGNPPPLDISFNRHAKLDPQSQTT